MQEFKKMKEDTLAAKKGEENARTGVHKKNKILLTDDL